MKKHLLIIFSILLFFSSIAQVEQLMMKLENVKNDTTKIKVLLDISIEYKNIDLDKAIDYSRLAYDLSINIKDTNSIISSSRHLSYNYSLKGKQKEALKVLYDGLDYVNSDEIRIQFYTNIGNCYNNFEDNEAGMENYTLALDLAKKIKNDKYVSTLELNRGLIFYQENKFDKALECYFNALEINKKRNDKTILLFNYVNIGVLHMKIDELDKASKYLHAHLNYAKEQNNSVHVLWGYNNLSKLKLKKGDFDIGLSYADSAIILANKLKHAELLSSSYRIRSKLNYALKNYEIAYDDIELRMSITDSINKTEKFDLAESVKLQHQFVEQTKILNLEKENARLAEKENRFNLIILTLIIIGIILLYVMKVKDSRNKAKVLQEKNEAIKFKNKSIELELEQKNKELTSNVLHLTNMNSFISSISSKLKEKKKDFKVENIKMINDIIREIQLNDNENIWKEFELRFESVHSGFYEKLLKDFPTLTLNERKLSAFLKLNMTSKDISNITGQSIHSIEMARARLRKKLGLANTKENLSNFISTY